jgi:ABC-type nitrate/sulfonate/bicarbonate transport system substrate-binding protein
LRIDCRRFVRTIVAAMLCAAAVAAGCGRQVNRSKLDKITVAIDDWAPSAPLYVADEKGYFRNEGLDVTFRSYPSGYRAFVATMSGKAEFATLADTPVANAAVRGEAFAVVATISDISSPDSIVARKDRGIRTDNDLRGKTIGVAKGTSPEFFLHVYLTTRYIGPKETRIVDLPAEKVADALLKGSVDAVCTWTQYTVVLQRKLGDRALVLDDPDIYTMSWNIATRKNFVNGHPECIKKLLRAVLRAETFIREHPAEARTITARRTDTKSAELDQIWDACTFETTLDQSLVVDVEDQVRWVIGRGLDSKAKMPDLLDFIYADGLKAVRPEAVTIAGK